MNETIDPIKLEAPTEQEKRPVSLTLLAWFEIIGGLLGIFNLWYQYGPRIPDYQLVARLELYHSLPLKVIVSVGLINAIAGIVIGIGILKRYELVRILFILTALEGFVVSIIDSKAPSELKIPIFIALLLFDVFVIYLLYRQPAKTYFSQLHPSSTEPHENRP